MNYLLNNAKQMKISFKIAVKKYRKEIEALQFVYYNMKHYESIY